MKSLIERELRGLARLAVIGTAVLLAAVLLLNGDFEFWNLNFMKQQLRPILLNVIMALWVIVVSDHVAGREGLTRSRRTLALLPISSHHVFGAKVCSCVIAIGMFAALGYGAALVSPGLLPPLVFDRYGPGFTQLEFWLAMSLLSTTIFFFSTWIRSSSGSLAASAIFLALGHLVFFLFWEGNLRRFDVTKDTMAVILSIGQATFALAFLFGSWRMMCRGQLHRSLRWRPIVVAVPAFVLTITPSLIWGGLVHAELSDFSVSRQDVTLHVGRVFATSDGDRVHIVVRKFGHEKAEGHLLFDPATQEFADLGVGQVPRLATLPHRNILISDTGPMMTFNSFNRQSSDYEVDPSGRSLGHERQEFYESRDPLLNPEPTKNGSTCFLGHVSSDLANYRNEKKLIVLSDDHPPRFLPGPRGTIRVSDNCIWAVEEAIPRTRPIRWRLTKLDPFTSECTDYAIPEIVRKKGFEVLTNYRPVVVGPGQVVAAGEEGDVLLLDLIRATRRALTPPKTVTHFQRILSSSDGTYIYIFDEKKNGRVRGRLCNTKTGAIQTLGLNQHILCYRELLPTSPDSRFLLGFAANGAFVLEMGKDPSTAFVIPGFIEFLDVAWIGPHELLVSHGRQLVNLNLETRVETLLLDLDQLSEGNQ
ncbi:MAG: hypothetical protein ACI97A_002390 [Planctomycetota bacterium]|jgi:hypothetical protein